MIKSTSGCGTPQASITSLMDVFSDKYRRTCDLARHRLGHEERRKVTVEFDLQTEVHPQECYPQKRRVGRGKINFAEFPAIPTVRRSGSFSDNCLAALDDCVVERTVKPTVKRVAVRRRQFATRESGEGLGPEGSGDVRATPTHATRENSSPRKMPPCPPPRTLTGRGYHPEAI